MSTEEDRHSVFNEPHLRNNSAQPPSSDAKPKWTYGDGESVYDELDIFPGRAPGTIEQDWSCSQCGYNLRGLRVGHPCPECGHREPYRPPPAGAPSYQTWLEQRIGQTSSRTGWWIAIGAALCGGPWAVLAALLSTGATDWAVFGMGILMIVYGPTVEETMKIATAAYIVEVRPYLFRRVEQVWLATLGGALMFAVIENILYLTVYVPNPSTELVIWRWTGCTALHIGCTAVATRGLTRVWLRTITEHRRPRFTSAVSALVVGIVIHGTYNLLALVYEGRIVPW